MKNYLLVLFSSFFLTASIPSGVIQGTTLEGKIIDEITKEGLILAEVILYKNGVFISGTTTNFEGDYAFSSVEPGTYDVEAKYLGYQTIRETEVVVKAGVAKILDIELSEGGMELDVVVIKEYKAPLIQQDNTTSGNIITSSRIRAVPSGNRRASRRAKRKKAKANSDLSIRGSRSKATNYYVDGVSVSPSHEPNHNPHREDRILPHSHDNEGYEAIVENIFVDPMDEALSTFSIDVDRASYSNVRRFIDNGQVPPADAVRIEEMVNYFDYDYPQPKKEDPIALHSTLTECPWNPTHEIMHIGLQGKEIKTEDLPPSNLVFLIDVSGSMKSRSKLPLVKSSFNMLLNHLRDKDRVAIVTYAGNAGIALKSTPASEKQKIMDVVKYLGAGGSTAGAEGILTAYQIAKENFIKDGNNRVILATDGDFNVGVSGNEQLEKLIAKERESGVFLSVLGFGMGNYKDDKMQVLAGKGNGNHAYIDNIQEARKVFINEFGGTLFTIAKDVKLQIEFNPALVAAYRLIGYENRLLNKEDFNNDKKDAGEMGAGHVVTAMYEIVPVGSNSEYVGNVDKLKYQDVKERPSAKHGDELATIKFRYKTPRGMKSKKIVSTIGPKKEVLKKQSDDLRFALAVAEFGMILRNSSFIEEGTFSQIIELAEKSRGEDDEGYRAEFIRIVKSVRAISGEVAQN